MLPIVSVLTSYLGAGIALKTPMILTKSGAKTIRSYERLILEHEKKLADYKANPLAYDILGTLKNAPEAIKQNIINGRIKALEKQLNKQRKVLEQEKQNPRNYE